MTCSYDLALLLLLLLLLSQFLLTVIEVKFREHHAASVVCVCVWIHLIIPIKSTERANESDANCILGTRFVKDLSFVLLEILIIIR